MKNNVTIIDKIKALMSNIDTSKSVKELTDWRNEVTQKRLSQNEVKTLTASCELLLVLAEIKAGIKEFGKVQYLIAKFNTKSMQTVYESLFCIIKELKLNLPTTRRLETKLNEFQRDGATALISKKRTLQNAAKATGDNRRLLNYLLSHPNRLDSTQIAKVYNYTVANVDSDMKPITSSNVRKMKRQGLPLLTHLSGSQGKRGVQKILMSRDRERPANALKFVSLDGWDVELGYTDIIQYEKAGKIVRNTVHGLRHNMVVVSDACIDFPLGYAIATHETSDLIKSAMRNALRFIKSVFGSYYYITQLKTDNFGSGSLKESYTMISKKWTPAAVGNANDKPIEAWFKRLNKRCQMEYNWTGYGNQAVTKMNETVRATTEWKKQLPTKQDNYNQIVSIMQEMQKEAFEVWYAMFDTSQLEVMSDENYLLALGEVRQRNGKAETYRLSHLGIKIIRSGEVFHYQSFDTAFKQYALCDWIIYEDPENFDFVLASTDEGRIRFLLENQQKSAMALADRTSEHNAYDAKIEAHNASIIREVVSEMDKDYQAAISIFEAFADKMGNAPEQLQKLMPVIGGQQKALQKVVQTKKALDNSKSKKTIELDDNDNDISALSAALDAL